MDAVSLFTNINIERVVEYIVNIIYDTKESAREFFNETRTNDNDLEVLLEVPPKKVLKNYFISVLTKFSSFSSNTGFFRQIQGVSMGGKLSSQLANIFCHMMEEKIIKRHIDNGNIIFYRRFVDDCFCALKKEHVRLSSVK